MGQGQACIGPIARPKPEQLAHGGIATEANVRNNNSFGVTGGAGCVEILHWCQWIVGSHCDVRYRIRVDHVQRATK